MNNIHLIVRGLILKSNYILLLRPSSDNKDFLQELSFLPGGHVDQGEMAKEALKRELLEELNIEFQIKECLGALECTWNRKGELYHELNLLFIADAPYLNLNNPPISNEKHIQFFWHPIADLASLNLLPKTLIEAIPQLLKEANKSSCLFSEMAFRQ